MAAPSPNGTATRHAQKVVLSVPTTSGRTPKLESANRGDHSVPVRYSRTPTFWKNSTVGPTREATMPTVVRTDTPAQANSTSLIAISP
jgi:hypothetical protein